MCHNPRLGSDISNLLYIIIICLTNCYILAWVPVHWLDNTLVKQLGQVSGVSVDPNNDDNIYLFHRGDRVWNMNVFGRENNYLQRDLGPISTPTIIVLHSNGSVIRSWGDGLFYLPHGITVDKHNNVWVTDVALHQVMKFPPSSNSPQIVLGEQFIPGKDSRHFCKPTSVAVASNGDFFVADGYCNFRILKFNAAGVKILEWGRSVLNAVVRPPGDNEFRIPHALTIAEDKDLLCVADRENGRVQCFNINNGTFVMSLSSPELGSRIFSVAYSPAKGMFFIINGPKLMGNSEPVCGHVVSAFDKFKIVARFGLSLKNPHNIAVSSDGKFVYVGELEPNMAWKFVQSEYN
ncbi:hypothetical protein AAG570_008048 [Ranatra chinensis]|uniref:peptidylamidoglycolate lyase n=1 Tax=Ranatra chinensis TaxID=642074 RepID=A0ABD0XVK9_9HEMI